MILYSRWIALPLHIRHKIAQEFNIEKKGATEVFSNTIKSDGFMIQDIETALNMTAIAEYLKTPETNPEILWEMFIAKMEGRPEPMISVLPPDEVKKFDEEYKERVKTYKSNKKVSALKAKPTKKKNA